MSESFGPLVSGSWLAEHRTDVAVVDVRWYLDGRSGWDAYLTGHVPGAIWLDLDAELSAPPDPAAGRHPLPAPHDFAAALGRHGIAAGQPVVCYDDAGGSVAARLWWLLHVLDEPVAVLDGGLAAWPGDLDTGVPPAAESVRRPPLPWPADRFATADEVASFEGVVLDARTAQRYREGGPIDQRSGHVPGADSAPWAGNLGPDGRFLMPADLADRYGLLGEEPVVAYCGSGVTACHDLLALEIVGGRRTRLYTGSWSQWGADLSRPVETAPGRMI